MLTVYNLIINLFLIAIKIHSLVNTKSKEWINGRKDIFPTIKSQISSEKIVWFHCASLGEYEQAKELIKKFKNNFSNYKILLTFFSPSGYKNVKKNKNINWVFYLPIDTKSNAKNFIDIINPKIVFFLKSEFWYNYMNTLNQKKIPLFHVSSNFRKNDFSINYSFSKKILAKSAHFFVQNKISKDLLKDININNVTVTKDSRFDSIIANIKLETRLEDIQKYCLIQPTIIFASIWPEDEHIYINFVKNNTQYNYIIVPHELNYCEEISKKLDTQLYSNFKEKRSNNILLVDKIGILKDIYKYCEIAYIGGGFGKGIHNLIEATANNIPVIFGPNYKKFKEAKELIELNSGKSIKNYNEFRSCIKTIKENFNSDSNKRYIHENSGASTKIIEFIKKNELQFLCS